MESALIRDVWADNLKMEFAIIRELIITYCYVAMDTEFPGVVARPIGNFKSQSDYHYQTLRCNVDLLKIIQLGLTFSDEDGNLPHGVCTWQFNFRFNLSEDMYAQDSIDLLKRSGINFKRHEEAGIDVADFGELMMTSGLLLDPVVKWVSFHSSYDFGYLLRLLTCEPLPHEEGAFFELLHLFFPSVYDIKYMMKSVKNFKGGLNDLAEYFEVQRIGPQHQAGSDSLLTLMVYFKLRERLMERSIDDAKFLGVLFGLGPGYFSTSQPATEPFIS